jgi:hypothetical protein
VLIFAKPISLQFHVKKIFFCAEKKAKKRGKQAPDTVIFFHFWERTYLFFLFFFFKIEFEKTDTQTPSAKKHLSGMQAVYCSLRKNPDITPFRPNHQWRCSDVTDLGCAQK